MNELDVAHGLAWYAVFLFSTTLHETAHAWAAMHMGDLTAYRGGQVSLNPVPHIRREPIGMVLVPLGTFLWFKGGFMLGWASTPYNVQWAIRYPKRSAWMSLAGPVSNLAVVLAAAVLIRIGMAMGALQIGPDAFAMNFTGIVTSTGSMGLAQGAALLLSIAFSLNLLLFCFNMIPLPPMDGSGVLTMFMSHETALRYRNLIGSPMIALLGFFLAFRYFGYVFAFAWLGALSLLFLGA